MGFYISNVFYTLFIKINYVRLKDSFIRVFIWLSFSLQNRQMFLYFIK